MRRASTHFAARNADYGIHITSFDLLVGERVVVHAMKYGEMLHTTIVRFGKSWRPRKTIMNSSCETILAVDAMSCPSCIRHIN